MRTRILADFVLRSSLALLAGMAALATMPSLAKAQRKPITREEILRLAKTGVGHAYKWGKSAWTEDGTRKGICVDLSGEKKTGCPDCTFTPDDALGADCAGFLSKVWQLPQPAAVTVEQRVPGGAAAFTTSTASSDWEIIDFSELKPGDAITSKNHVVLYNGPGGKGYLTMEAKGCQWNICEDSLKLTPTDSGTAKSDSGREWFAARRRDLEEKVICTPETCSHRGSCLDGVCTCDEGFRDNPETPRTSQCDACADGYWPYPGCPRINECSHEGPLTCEDQFVINPGRDGRSFLQNYGGAQCSGSGAERELAYRFAPPGSGEATVKITGGGSLKVLRGACVATACVAEGTNSVKFTYGGGEVFYIVVEGDGGTSEVSLRVDCETDASEFIGDPCNDDGDCDEMFKANGNAVPGGYCYRSQGANATGFCSTPCGSSGCSDRWDHAETFCVGSPEDRSKGMCVSKSVDLSGYCRSVPGTVSSNEKRVNNDVHAEVCYPASAVACTGSVALKVVDLATDIPITGAGIESPAGAAPSAVTGMDGMYNATALPCGEYALTVSASGYVTETVRFTLTRSNTTLQLARLATFQSGMCMDRGTIAGTVFDGTSSTRSLVADTQIELFRGLGTDGAEPVAVVASEPDGSYEFADLEPGTYTAVTSADGFASSESNFVSCDGADATLDPADIAVVPIALGSMRLVLDWDRPDDLDLHLQMPNGDEVHFWDPCRSLGGAELNIDQVTAVGPEVITINRFEPGLYTVFVHNYSAQRDGAEGFASSNATLTLQGPDGSELARYAVPTTGDGFFWDVVRFEGNDPEELFPMQRLTNGRANPYDEYTADCHP